VFTDGYVPVISQTVGKRTYYYYDFETAYEILTAANASIINTYKTADEYSAAFIKAYTDEANAEAKAEAAGEDKLYDLPLNDILANDDFTSGNIVLNVSDSETSVGSTTMIYSSGAITTKSDTTFNMIVKNDESVFSSITALFESLLGSNTSLSSNTATTALDYSKAISKEYLYMKWNLGHFAEDGSEAAEQTYVDGLLANGWTEDMLTPINKYMVFSSISSDAKDEITPSGFTLASDYKVWVCNGDVEVGKNKIDYTDETNGIVKGIVITKGDVTFNEKVKKFEGLIVAGGKIYISGKLESITASPEICRSVIKECILVNDDKSKYVRNVFAQYKISDDGKCPICGATLVETVESDTKISTCPTNGCTYNAGATNDELLVGMDNIDYTDVCAIDNWNKKVE
jgi:hypothetical protein